MVFRTLLYLVNPTQKGARMCAIAGVSCPRGCSSALRRTYDALRMMNHRGQDGSGMVAIIDNAAMVVKRSGLVQDVYTEAWRQSDASVAIGHNRYATQGDTNELNLQPHAVPCGDTQLFIASNGDIPQYDTLRAELERENIVFRSRNDGELLGHLLAREYHACGAMAEAIRRLFVRIEGAYAAVVLFKGHLYAFRDPRGFRPLAFVQLADGTAVVASETVAFGILGADVKTYTEIRAGSIVEFADGNLTIHEAGHEATAPCIFELVYFARPDSQVFDLPVYLVRRRIGWRLAEESGWTSSDRDIVVAVPDSANEIARGLAQALDLPLEPGLMRSHTSHRTFIQSTQEFRDEEARYKLNPLYLVLEGRRVLLVDDSIVRGTTIKKIVHMLKHAGAAEVHLLIGSPPIRWPCFMGIATRMREELVANAASPEEIAARIGAASLRHISLAGLKAATGPFLPDERKRYRRFLAPFLDAPPDSFRGRAASQFALQQPENRCTACFDGSYSINVPLARG